MEGSRVESARVRIRDCCVELVNVEVATEEAGGMGAGMWTPFGPITIPIGGSSMGLKT